MWEKSSWKNITPSSNRPSGEVNLVPAFAKEETAAQVVRLPVSLSAGLTASSLALSLMAGGLASYFMARRTGGMKPAQILRKM